MIRGPATIRGRLYFAAAATSLLILISWTFLVVSTTELRRQMIAATEAHIEEQQIANQLARTNTYQLIAGSHFATQHSDSALNEFRAAGEKSYVEIQRYLFRSLTPTQRLQLQEVKEQQERMEVAAIAAFDLFARGRTAEGEDAAIKMAQHGTAMRYALDSFLAAREQDLIALRRRQADIVRYIYVSAVIIALLLLVGLLTQARVLHRRIANPLEELANAATRIGAGDLNTRVTPARDDELASLANSFNQMAERVGSSNAELEDRNQQLEEALRKLGNAQRELVQTEKLRAMGQMMAGLAHELNNPLASVVGYAELLGSRLDDTSELNRTELAEGYVEPLLAEAIRARTLVRDFLEFARKPESGFARVSLGEVLSLVTRLRSYAFEQAGLSLIVDVPDEIEVIGQSQRLQQVFLNITNNSLDAMRVAGHGSLRISAEIDENFVKVYCDDDGPGITAPEHIFEPFYTTKAVGAGTGLGLTLVHQYVTEVGGSVRAENHAAGGARFVLTLPLAPPSLALVPESPSHSADAGKVKTAAQRSLSPRILVVEDEAPLRNLQERVLKRRRNAQVFTAIDVNEAEAIIKVNELDLIISDVKMPGEKNGLDLFTWILSEHPEMGGRFLFVTGDVTDSVIAGVAAQRPGQVVHKPFLVDEYLAQIDLLLVSD